MASQRNDKPGSPTDRDAADVKKAIATGSMAAKEGTVSARTHSVPQTNARTLTLRNHDQFLQFYVTA